MECRVESVSNIEKKQLTEKFFIIIANKVKKSNIIEKHNCEQNKTSRTS